MSKKKKILIFIGVAAALIILYFVFFGTSNPVAAITGITDAQKTSITNWANTNAQLKAVFAAKSSQFTNTEWSDLYNIVTNYFNTGTALPASLAATWQTFANKYGIK